MTSRAPRQYRAIPFRFLRFKMRDMVVTGYELPRPNTAAKAPYSSRGITDIVPMCGVNGDGTWKLVAAATPLVGTRAALLTITLPEQMAPYGLTELKVAIYRSDGVNSDTIEPEYAGGPTTFSQGKTNIVVLDTDTMLQVSEKLFGALGSMCAYITSKIGHLPIENFVPKMNSPHGWAHYDTTAKLLTIGSPRGWPALVANWGDYAANTTGEMIPAVYIKAKMRGLVAVDTGVPRVLCLPPNAGDYSNGYYDPWPRYPTQQEPEQPN